jgi:hypothetical protein
MKKPIRLLLALSAVLAVAACAEPYPMYYAVPEPAPLQPYLGPPVAPPTVVRRVVRHHYVRHVRRHRRVRCRCEPVQ